LAPFSTSQSISGWVFGGQAGYNWQFNQSWLFDVEADIQGTGQKATTTLPTVVIVPAVAVALLPTITTTGSL
jgi:outer membrane immunogenic protein